MYHLWYVGTRRASAMLSVDERTTCPGHFSRFLFGLFLLARLGLLDCGLDIFAFVVLPYQRTFEAVPSCPSPWLWWVFGLWFGSFCPRSSFVSTSPLSWNPSLIWMGLREASGNDDSPRLSSVSRPRCQRYSRLSFVFCLGVCKVVYSSLRLPSGFGLPSKTADPGCVCLYLCPCLSATVTTSLFVLKLAFALVLFYFFA